MLAEVSEGFLFCWPVYTVHVCKHASKALNNSKMLSRALEAFHILGNWGNGDEERRGAAHSADTAGDIDPMRPVLQGAGAGKVVSPLESCLKLRFQRGFEDMEMAEQEREAAVSLSKGPEPFAHL